MAPFAFVRFESKRGPSPRLGAPAAGRRSRVLRGARLRTGILAAVAFAACLAGGGAHAAAAHVHGRAILDVAVDGPRVTIDFSSPLDNLLGFERAPRDERERAAVRRMADALRSAETLFVPAPEARCTRESLTFESPVLAPELLGSTAAAPRPAAPPPKAGDGHAALDLILVYRCAEPRKLNALDVPLFERYPRLHRIEARVAAGGRQAAATLTPRKRRLEW